MVKQSDITKEEWARAQRVCGKVQSSTECATTKADHPALECRWSQTEKVIEGNTFQAVDRPSAACRPWNSWGTELHLRRDPSLEDIAWIPISLATFIFIIAAILVGVTTSLIKGGLDLFPLIAAGWFVAGWLVVSRVKSYSGLILGLVVFLFIDGVVDSFGTGGFLWIGPPWILDAAYWTIPGIGETYLLSLWVFGFVSRSYLAATKVTLDWFKNLGWTIGSYIISAGGISDYINLALRPKVPDFINYFAPLGFWTWELFTIRTIIHTCIGIAVILTTTYIAKRSILLSVGFIGLAALLATYPFLLDLFI